MSGTAEGSVAWGRLRRTRLAYRLLLLVAIAVYAASQMVGVPASDEGRFSLPYGLFVATGFIYAVFLYFFLETARLMGHPGSRVVAIALLALVPLANIPTIVILDIWTGVMIARSRQAAIGLTEIGVGLAETADATAGRLGVSTCRPLTQRLPMSFLVGLAVFAISCSLAFGTFRDIPSVEWCGRYTLTTVASVRKAIEVYRQERHRLPKSLRELTLPANGPVPSDETGMPQDGWLRPLHYATDGSTYRVTSYGRDGKPGGIGLDFDLSTVDLPNEEVPAHTLPPLPRQARATFWQFVGDLGEFGRTGSGRGMFLTSIWAGVVAFVLGFVLSAAGARTRRGALASLLQVVIAVIGTLFIACIIAVLHIPTGH